MTPYLVLSLALLGAEPAADCGCGPQPTAQTLSDTVPTAAGITDDCYCPQFIESLFAGPNYWRVFKYPPNSGMETDCFTWDEVVIFATLNYGECDNQCSDPNCWLGGSFLRSTDDEAQPQDVEAPEAAENAARPPSLRLPNKKRAQTGVPEFEFPMKLNAHIDFRDESIRPTLLKVTTQDGKTFTWLQLYDLQPKEEGRRVHRVGHEIEPPAGSPEAETVEVDKLKPVVLDPASKNFPGEVIDGYYRLLLPEKEDAAETETAENEKPKTPRVYYVRMNSLLPSEAEKRELLPRPTIAVEPDQE